jgi:hypothetical protein
MKCNTKSCQRSKNILANGFCNTCDEAKKLENPQKKKASKEIELNVREIETIYNKLKIGDKVDQNVVNSVIIGGILAFISQKEASVELTARVTELESDLKTAKLRIESLENWMNKNDVDKEAIKKDMKECSNMVVELCKQKEGPVTQNEAVTKKSSQQKCGECGEIFDKNSDFEVHMEEAHKVNKTYKCEVCGKMFLHEWRLRKHGNVHKENPKKCKFFLNKEPCPFDRIGCKFDHDTIEDNDIETVEEEITLDQNQCHLCRQQLQSNDHLMDHIEAVHVDYFEGIMEYAATTRT